MDPPPPRARRGRHPLHHAGVAPRGRRRDARGGSIVAARAGCRRGPSTARRCRHRTPAGPRGRAGSRQLHPAGPAPRRPVLGRGAAPASTPQHVVLALNNGGAGTAATVRALQRASRTPAGIPPRSERLVRRGDRQRLPRGAQPVPRRGGAGRGHVRARRAWAECRGLAQGRVRAQRPRFRVEPLPAGDELVLRKLAPGSPLSSSSSATTPQGRLQADDRRTGPAPGTRPGAAPPTAGWGRPIRSDHSRHDRRLVAVRPVP